MNTQGFIKIRDTAIVTAVVALCVAGFYATARLALESRENETLHEQNRVLAERLKDLGDTFGRINGFTHSVKALATADIQTIMADNENSITHGGMIDFAAVKGTLFGSDSQSFAEMLDMVNTMNSNAERVARRLESLSSILRTRKDLLSNIPSMMPAEGRIASEFGVRLSPFEGKRHMHAGIDIAAKVGEKVVAPADGEVTFAGDFETLGHSLVLNHGNGILTRYGHTSKLLVKVGQKVKRGQLIALVGNTGRSTGPHLHYEVWVQNSAVNPRDFFFDIVAKPSTLAKVGPKTLPEGSTEALAAMGGDL